VYDSSCLPLSIRVRSKNLLVHVHGCSGRSSTCEMNVSHWYVLCALLKSRLSGIKTLRLQAVSIRHHSQLLLLIPKTTRVPIDAVRRSGFAPQKRSKYSTCVCAARSRKISRINYIQDLCFLCCSAPEKLSTASPCECSFWTSLPRYRYFSILSSLPHSHLSALVYYPEGNTNKCMSCVALSLGKPTKIC
jgi:hypothetical protein